MSNSPASLPSPTTVNDGGSLTASTITSTTNATNDSSSPSSTIFIIIIVLASVILILALIFIIIRIFHVLNHRTTSPPPAVNHSRRDRINSNCYNNRNVSSPKSILDSLPLFSYNTVTGNLTGGDCAVCLSKFEGDDQLRLLPLCCHAFHARCIDTWLSSHMTCPLCRSSANPTESDVLNKIRGTGSSSIINGNSDNINNNNNNGGGRSFRIEIGSVSNRRSSSSSAAADSIRRSYSIGEFEYIVNDGCEIPVDRIHRRSPPEVVADDDQKEVLGGGVLTSGAPHGERLVEEVAGGRSWLRDYVDRLGSLSFSTRTLSIRSSGRYFTGSSRRSDVVLAVEDLEAHRIGEEISEMFRWLSGA